MKYDLAVFDMDGTILDTLEDLKNSLNYSLRKSRLPERTLAEVRNFVGNGIRKLVERGVPEGTSTELTDEVFRSFNEHYAVHCFDHTIPYDGISALLEDVRRIGIKTAVVSNKSDYAVQSLCGRYFRGLFDFAVGAKDGIRKKPYPDSVNEAIKLIGAEKPRTVYIGDSEVDIETAKNAGIDCISVDWGFRERDILVRSGAELIVSDMESLERAIIA